MNDISWEEKDLKCKEKGLHIKFTEQIKDYPDYYADKIKRLEKIEAIDKETEKAIKDKIKRLEDKQQSVLFELKGRKLGYFKRTPHGTIYYIDLNAGNDGNTGLVIAQAWRTIEKYTTLTVRTAGDIAYLRANTQEIIAATVQFDEDGDQDDMLSIIGCDATTDPWGDGSNVKPIITANGAGNRYFYLLSDDYWYLKNFDIQDSTGELIRLYYAYNNIFDDLELHEAQVCAIRSYLGNNPLFKNCYIYDNDFYNLYIDNGGFMKLQNCIIDAGVGGTQYGILMIDQPPLIEIDNCLFGQTNPHANHDIQVNSGCGFIKMRNTKYNSINFQANSKEIWLNSEDHQQVLGAGFIQSLYGSITKDTAIKTGGADFSLKFEPTAYCGLNAPLKCEQLDMLQSSYVVDGVGNLEITLTVKIRSLGVWAAYPTADELYIEASYLSNALTCARSTIQSTAVLIDETTWISFSVTLTPLRSGPIYVNVYLKKFEANKGCYANGEILTN